MTTVLINDELLLSRYKLSLMHMSMNGNMLELVFTFVDPQVSHLDPEGRYDVRGRAVVDESDSYRVFLINMSGAILTVDAENLLKYRLRDFVLSFVEQWKG